MHVQVVSRAQMAVKVPPSLVVISRVRRFHLCRGANGGYGFTVRGNCPVFVRSVDLPGPARQAGVRSGDLILEVEGKNVRHASKLEVLELLRASGAAMAMKVIARGLDWNPLSSTPALFSSPSSSSSSFPQPHRLKKASRYKKAQDFHNKVSGYALILPTILVSLLIIIFSSEPNISSFVTAV